jgi:carbonic anhydrase
MRDVVELVEGYRRFLDNRYSQEASLYRSLADGGQSPRTMVIACCDSRVDPAAIFNARPGELFVLRNVANLVPPYEPHGDYHGTSAALEFAVTGLNVETIVVMGHARCGGVRAYLDGLYEKTTNNGFINRWMSLLNAARTEALRASAKEPIEVQQKSLEHASVRHSIDNLMTFPFIKENIAAGRLRLRGAYFDIADGKLLSLDDDNGAFRPIDFE